MSCGESRGVHETLIGGLGLLVFFLNAGPDPALPQELLCGHEKVLKRIPVMGVDLIHQRHKLRVVDADVSEEFPDMREVFFVQRSNCRPSCRALNESSGRASLGDSP